MVFATLAGLVLSIIFVAARNLIAPIIVHATYDAFFLWEASPFFGESTAVLGQDSRLIRRGLSGGSSEGATSGLARLRHAGPYNECRLSGAKRK